MKYSELEKKLRKIGCYYTGKTVNGHPEWFSPKTGNRFQLGHHKSQEVAIKTLLKIIKASGL